MPSNMPNRSGARKAARRPRQRKIAKTKTTIKAPTNPSSSPTTAKMKSECEGQEQKFLPALCESQSVRAAGANCDQRLDHLITGALRIGPGIDKSRQTLHAKRGEDEHLADVQQCRDYCVHQMSRPHAGGKTNREADDRQHQR